MIELAFVTHNRLEFTVETIDALLNNTNWDLVQKLHIIDDRSTDGTLRMLHNVIRNPPCAIRLTSERFGGPVAALNNALDFCRADILGKIDSDLVVCPGWLDEMLNVLEGAPNLDALGMEPNFGAHVSAQQHLPRTWKGARWIGGIGLFRTKIFARRRPVQNDRFYGLTAFWRRYGHCGWITPDLPVFLLDKLPFEPWLSLTKSYVEKGWARAWPVDLNYGRDLHAYWDWWTHGVEVLR